MAASLTNSGAGGPLNPYAGVFGIGPQPVGGPPPAPGVPPVTPPAPAPGAPGPWYTGGPQFNLGQAFQGWQGMDNDSKAALFAALTGFANTDPQGQLRERIKQSFGSGNEWQNWFMSNNGGNINRQYNPLLGLFSGGDGGGGGTWVDPRYFGWGNDYLNNLLTQTLNGTGQNAQQYFQNMYNRYPVQPWQQNTQWTPSWFPQVGGPAQGAPGTGLGPAVAPVTGGAANPYIPAQGVSTGGGALQAAQNPYLGRNQGATPYEGGQNPYTNPNGMITRPANEIAISPTTTPTGTTPVRNGGGGRFTWKNPYGDWNV